MLLQRLPFFRLSRRLFSSSSTSAAAKASSAVSEEGPLTETVRDFLPPNEFYDYLTSKDINFYTGVPDSLLKDFCSYVQDHSKNHIIAANEGAAVSIAAGYHLATKKFPLVYLQNSGLGNLVNPLLSLADRRVYSVPMLLMIGWRGEPGKKDEPQHLVQGRVMGGMLTEMGVNFEVLPDFIEGARNAVDSAIHYMQTRQSPYALIVRRQCFTPYKLINAVKTSFPLTREQALRVVVDHLGKHDLTVATTGFASRELYELREERKEDHGRDFLCVGSMGHASAIALGIAVAKPSRQVWCLDGDGALLMHMGTLSTIGHCNAENLKHIVFNNGAHDSVGGQGTAALNMDLGQVAAGSGYRTTIVAETEEQIKEGVKELRHARGPAFLEIKVNRGARKNLGRPKTSPVENKTQFMRFCEA